MASTTVSTRRAWRHPRSPTLSTSKRPKPETPNHKVHEPEDRATCADPGPAGVVEDSSLEEGGLRVASSTKSRALYPAMKVWVELLQARKSVMQAGPVRLVQGVRMIAALAS